MARITIHSEGVGLIYQKNNTWKILYPFGNGHDVNIQYKSEDDANYKDLGDFGSPNKKLALTTTKANKTANRGANFRTLFNINDGHLRGVKLKDDWNQFATLFEIQDARIDVLTTQSRYVLSFGGINFERLGHIGFSITAEINLEDKETFTLTEGGRPLFQSVDGKSYDIKVCNDCPKTKEIKGEIVDKVAKLKEEFNSESSESFLEFIGEKYRELETELKIQNTTDFEMLYNFLEDKLVPGYKIKVIRDSRDLPKLGSIILKPFNTDPEPGEDGKPCHKVQSDPPDPNFP